MDKNNNDNIDDELAYRERELKARDKRIAELLALLDGESDDVSADDARTESAAVAAEKLQTSAPKSFETNKVGASEENVHAGHRIRLRESALRDPSLASFSDVEIIELVLSFMIPRRDTNVLAHRLLDKFGSVLGVLTAPPSELAEFAGMTRNAVDFISVLPLIGQAKQRSAEIEISRGDILINHIASIGVKKGETLAVFLDERFGLLSDQKIPSKDIPVREIVASACRLHAKYVFVGRRLSVADRPADELRVKDLETVLDAVDAELIDYIQVGIAGYGSRKLDLAKDPSGRIWQYMPSQLLSPSPELLLKLWETDNDKDPAH